MSYYDHNERVMRTSLDRYITGNYGEDQFRYDCMHDYPYVYREWAWGRTMRFVYRDHLYYPMWDSRSFTHQAFWLTDLRAYRKRKWRRHMARVWRHRKRGYHDPDICRLAGSMDDPGHYYGAGAVQLRDLP